MIDLKQHFMPANGYSCVHCALFFDEFDEKSFLHHLEKEHAQEVRNADFREQGGSNPQ